MDKRKYPTSKQNVIPPETTSDSEGHKIILESVVIGLSYLLLILFFPFSLLVSFRVTQEYERAVVFRLGWIRKGKPLGPGLLFLLPCTDTFFKIDLRIVTYNGPQQEVLTKDSCTVAVDAVIYYRVEKPLFAILKVDNYRVSSWKLTAAKLRNVLGQKTLMEILTEKDTLAKSIKLAVDKATTSWGVKVENIEIKDVRLPTTMQRAMAAEAEAAREARARMITAEGEMKAAANLRDASDIITANPSALKLRYLQTLTSIAAQKRTNIFFPIPMVME